MPEVAAYSVFALTIGVAVARPRIGGGVRLGPAAAGLAGVVAMLLAGWVAPGEVLATLARTWQPLVAIVSIMLMAASAERLGGLALVASWAFGRERLSAQALFARTFALSALSAAVLNNDAAILLVTPLVVSHARRAFPGRPRLWLAFAAAVFMSAGVAPLVVSNPMNTFVASVAGIGFNEYALAMVPACAASALASYVTLRWVFARELAAAGRAVAPPRPSGDRRQAWVLVLLAAVLVAYPIMAHFDGPIWCVAVAGAIGCLAIAAGRRARLPLELVHRGVSWQTVAFVVAIFVLVIGLRNAGLVETLAGFYQGASLELVGAVSAAGSAIVNNHPMAMMNLMALDNGQHDALFAALVGGDLGPRLLPTGSLAGLLWLASLRRLGIEMPLRRFVALGVPLFAVGFAAAIAALRVVLWF